MKGSLHEAALEYARRTVQDPDNHQDAIEVISEDFIAGANWAMSHR